MTNAPTPPSTNRTASAVQDPSDPPVTVIRDIHVRPGEEGRFELLMGEFIAEASRQPGHMGATVLRPNGRPGPYRFVYKFDRRTNLIAWHASAHRTRLFEPITELITSNHFDEYRGLETWFDLPPHAAPPKWKTTLITWAAIFVLVMAYGFIIQAGQVRLPVPISALLSTGIIVPLVAYAIGPILGSLFRGWLTADPPITAPEHTHS